MTNLHRYLTVHLAAVAIEALREHRRIQLEERLAAGSLWKEQGLIFSSLWGGPLDLARIRQNFYRALARAGLH